MGSKLKKLKKQLSANDKTLRIYQLDVSTTIEELEASVRKFGADVLATGEPYYALVSGYDDDPRELSQIPEVADLCQRVIDSGFIGLLGDNAEIDVDKENPFIDMHMCFQLAKGGLISNPAGGGLAFLTPEMAKEFLRVMDAANTKVDQLLAEPVRGEN